MTQLSVERLSPAQARASLEQSELRSSEKVAAALGLKQLDAASMPSTADLQRSLREVMNAVRSGDGQRAGLSTDPGIGLLASTQSGIPISALGPAFNHAIYNPAILHLRYLGPGEQAAPNSARAHLELVLITASGEPMGLRVEIRASEFRESLQKLYGAVARQEPLLVQDPQSPSRSLYRQIFAPLQPLLQEQKITTLLLSADQGLQAIPYPALHDGLQFLGERYGLALTPSLNLTNLRVPLGRGGGLLALGASQFDGLAPLALVPEELRSIAAGQRANIYLNQAFTPASLLITAADSRYRRVHVATHAEFLPGGPSQSRIYTGTGPVALSEFSGLRSRRQDASLDLISLSACRTALGDGESELGFAGMALQAGARSAMGSLWYLDDVATSAFFVQAYRLIDAGVPKAEALQLTRQAFSRGQIRLEGDQVVGVDGEVLLSGLDKSQRRIVASGLSHPYFWGGIQLLGSPW
ncbi:CHAT domain-containing protein [Cyanobium sp. HWJ4-Hawea]|uniref:CHAT domain-containing protein n=1 Tax=Cyanobium sp. HWJ4-Hawea TaxID=2823713 RepID=UPI0020CCFC89|nr:CHAT domain-containing protein [Cyanobium sp. HWJ4-Hawea]